MISSPKLAFNLIPPDLSLPSSEDYSCEQYWVEFRTLYLPGKVLCHLLPVTILLS
jgi:hypothetical protein